MINKKREETVRKKKFYPNDEFYFEDSEWKRDGEDNWKKYQMINAFK